MGFALRFIKQQEHMCTVTFVPISKTHFVLNSNRDESPLRSPQALYDHGEKQLVYPREPYAGGTWICVSKKGTWVCLLNGAFAKHVRRPPYRRSRGLVVLDFFDYTEVTDFFEYYDLNHIEPFTIIAWSGLHLYDFRWDGERRYLKELNTQKAHIWSSCPLYSPKIQAKREQWFADFLNQQELVEASQILEFHKHAGDGNKENDLIMERYQGQLRTVSITTIEQKETTLSLFYNDLVHEKNDSRTYTILSQEA